MEISRNNGKSIDKRKMWSLIFSPKLLPQFCVTKIYEPQSPKSEKADEGGFGETHFPFLVHTFFFFGKYAIQFNLSSLLFDFECNTKISEIFINSSDFRLVGCFKMPISKFETETHFFSRQPVHLRFQPALSEIILT